MTAANKSIAWGDPTPTFTSSATGLISGHSLTGVTYTFEGTGSTSYGPSTTPPTSGGTYSITPSAATVTGGNQGNYSFTYINGTFTITPRAITITAAAKTKTYGDADPAFTYTVTSGSLGGGSLGGSLDRDAGEDVGQYNITQGSLDSSNNPNYTITFVGAKLTINKKTITVTADAQTKVYGDNDPELTYSSSGLINGDLLSGSMTRASGESVGTSKRKVSP